MTQDKTEINKENEANQVSGTTPGHKEPRAAADRVLIFDTTLRDGEQSPGASMTLDEKLNIVEILDAMGVDIIEAGFPIASNGDFEAVTEVSKLAKNSVICGLARAGAKDIDRAGEALKPAKAARLHTFIATSEVHMKHKLQMSPDEVLEAIAFSVDRARQYTDDVEWSAEDATRSDRDFLCKCVDVAIKAGATTINIPDTVGYTLPQEYIEIITLLRNSVSNIDRATLSTHCHNDLGLAVANSLAGVQAGARQIECTINGLGERAGNAALEEVVMALNVRSDLMPQWTGIDTTYLARASKLVSNVTAFPVQYNKAIVGKNAFAHESGIHQDGMLKNNETYEIMLPETVGINKSSLVMGKHSGRHAFREKVHALGYDMSDNQIQDAFVRFKDLADKKKHVFDDDIVALVDDQVALSNDKIKVVSLQVIAGSVGPQKATLELAIDGVVKSIESTGDGPVDATFNAIKMLFPTKARLQLYQVHAVTQGTDAQAEVSVRLEEEGKTVTGRGVDTDTLVASAKAYVSALNKLLVKRLRHAPDDVAAIQI